MKMKKAKTTFSTVITTMRVQKIVNNTTDKLLFFFLLKWRSKMQI